MNKVFTTQEDEEQYYAAYDQTLTLINTKYESIKISTSNGLTHVLIFGNQQNPPLILLHGMTLSSSMWYPNIDYLVERYCVYAVDTLGDFGKGQVTTSINSREIVVTWLKEVIDGLNLDKIYLVGHSFGGFIALNFALAMPDRIRKLVLYAPAATFYRLNPMFFIKVFPALKYQSEKLTDKLLNWFTGKKSTSLHPAFREQIVAAYKTGYIQLQLYPIQLPAELFTNFTLKTLLMIGDKEVLYPYKKAIRNALKVIPNLEAHVIKGAGHLLTLEFPEVINEITLKFLDE